MQLELGNSVVRKSRWHMSSQWLEEAREGIIAAWHQCRLDAPFLSKLKAVSKFYRNFCKRKAHLLRAEEATAHRNFEAASLQLNLSPGDPLQQQRHGHLRQALQNLESRKVEGKRIRSRIRWNFKGDRLSTEFFKAVREKSTATALTGIKDPAGTLVADSCGLSRLTSTFFQSLYTSEVDTPEHQQALEALLADIPSRFPPTAQAQLDRPLSSEELLAVAKSMVPNKSPGPDGLIVEFYTKFWNLIRHDYTKMVQESIQQGHFPHRVNKGLIALIHKGNAIDDLGNWRPISLLNVAYKIMAKALQRRLQPLLSKVISPDQTAFLPYRYILDNVLVLHESIAWAHELEQDMALFKLDFCKAYDTVHLPSLFQIMRAFGVPELFLQMT
jgi:hypothetical protein